MYVDAQLSSNAVNVGGWRSTRNDQVMATFAKCTRIFFGAPRSAQVGEAIQECKDAGIRVIMITGDNKLTAEAVARDIGIFDADTDVSTKSITGAPLQMLR